MTASTVNLRSAVAAEISGQNVFTEVKEAVPMREAVSFYGYEPNRAGFICCPFHVEKTPSLKINERSFHCFGCGAHGSVIDFVALLFNLDPLGAVKRLAADFKIDLKLEHPPDRPQVDKLREARRLFTEWKERTLNEIDRCIRIANTTDFTAPTDSAAVALRYRECMEAWADELLHGTIEQQMQIFRMREGVTRLCKRILRDTPRRLSAA